MTDRTRPAPMTCPSFEDLSCFVDDELDDASAAAIRTHVAVCTACSGLSAGMRVQPDAAPAAVSAASVCALATDPEDLVAYLSDGSEVDAAFERHLLTCTACVDTLARMQRRLRVSTTTAAVQASPAARRAPALAAMRPARRPAAGGRGWRTAARTRLSILSRLPVLMPLSFAAGAVLMLMAQTWSGAPQPFMQTRSVAPRRILHVTSARAVVYAAPDPRAAAVTTLTRDTAVDVVAEAGTWYHIRTAQQAEGWVDRRAVE